MLPRFYVPAIDPAAGSVSLPDDEARHLTRVMRLGARDEIAVFDGRGPESRARVSGRAADRWRRVAVSSAKQCRRATVPAVGSGIAFEQWIAGCGAGMKL